jgi:hypothetical protein
VELLPNEGSELFGRVVAGSAARSGPLGGVGGGYAGRRRAVAGRLAPVRFAFEERVEVRGDAGVVDVAARTQVGAGVDRREGVGGVGELVSGQSFDP